MPQQTIRSENFGAWLLKCNPNVWDLAAYIEEGGDWIDQWTVVDNYRSRMVAAGDPVVLWVTGRPNAPLEPGIWGVGHITGPLRTEVRETDSSNDADPSVGYWLDPDLALTRRFVVDTDIDLLDVPVPRSALATLRAFRDAEVLRQPQMSNPSWLTKDEWTALKPVLGEAVHEPLSIVDRASLTVAAELKPPDYLTKVAIERAAIDTVRSSLEGAGWRVVDRQSDNIGWDLTATKGGATRHIEVKGRGVQTPTIILTANELRAATESTAWELAIVTSALDAPTLTWLTSAETVALALPIAYRLQA